MMRGLLVLLVLAGLGGASIVFRDSPPSTSVALRFSDAELGCLLEQKVLHSDGKCYYLRRKGPCLEGQWLVLDKTGDQDARKLVCQPLPCNRALLVYWPADGECHKVTEKNTLCPYAANELRSDSYGDGECACVKTHARLDSEVVGGRNTTAEWEGDCYALYRGGPCPKGKVLTPVYMDGYGLVGRCLNDACKRENARASPGGEWHARHAPDGRCYKLGSRGACAAEEKFVVHPVTNKPQCLNPLSVVNMNSLYGDSAMRCDGNVNAMTLECREELIVNMQTSPFVTEVTGKRRVRRRG